MIIKTTLEGKVEGKRYKLMTQTGLDNVKRHVKIQSGLLVP